jgi:hypothetical protein
MADNEKKVDLREIEPLRPPPDTDPEPKAELEDADRVAGVGAETIDERRKTEDEELEHLRRS